jgi:hypothetical protein
MPDRTEYSILVNTTDSFEDCWDPYFKLFAKYWPNFNGKIYLNTEFKDYHYSSLDITALKVGKYLKRGKLTWSECLLKAMELIETETILFLLDDLFIIDYVNNSNFEKLVDIHINNDFTYLGLGGNSGPFHNTNFEDIYRIDQNAEFRISALPSIWNINRMKKYIRKNENPWQFEVYGSKRAHYIEDKFYAINENTLGKNTIIKYPSRTGIVRGKWQRQMVDIFKTNSIYMDFNKRGFWDPYEKRTFIEKILKRLSFSYHYNRFISIFSVIKLKLFYFLKTNF